MWISKLELDDIKKRISDLEEIIAKNDMVIYEYPSEDITDLLGFASYPYPPHKHKIKDVLKMLLSHLGLELKTTDKRETVELVESNKPKGE